jgi:hypothetical protein
MYSTVSMRFLQHLLHCVPQLTYVVSTVVPSDKHFIGGNGARITERAIISRSTQKQRKTIKEKLIVERQIKQLLIRNSQNYVQSGNTTEIGTPVQVTQINQIML